jgi:tetratricopeptide (TPR) repeat protein
MEPKGFKHEALTPLGSTNLKEAQQNLSLGNPALAIDGFRKALRNEPGLIEAHTGMAAAYDRLGRYDLSRRYYEQALALDPQRKSTYLEMAASLLSQGRLSEAEGLEREAEQVTGVSVNLPEPLSGRELAIVSAPTSGPPKPRLASPSANRGPAGVSQPYLALKRVSRLEVALVASKSLGAPATAANESLLRGRSGAEGSGRRLLQIRNAMGRRGLAGRMGHYLQGNGWTRYQTADASRKRFSSLIVVPPTDYRRAVLLKRQLSFAPRIVTSNSTRSIILILGSDAASFDAQLTIPRQS